MLETCKVLLRFILSRRKFWLLPIVVLLLLIGGLIIAAESSVFAPLIYTIF